MHTCKKCCFAPTCLLSSSSGFKIFFSSSSLIPDMLSFSSLHFFPLIHAQHMKPPALCFHLYLDQLCLVPHCRLLTACQQPWQPQPQKHSCLCVCVCKNPLSHFTLNYNSCFGVGYGFTFKSVFWCLHWLDARFTLQVLWKLPIIPSNYVSICPFPYVSFSVCLYCLLSSVPD